MLRKKILFGFDFPVIAPDHWLADFAQLEIKDDVRPLILKDNAIRMLGLAPAPSTTRPPRTDNGVDDDRRNHPHPGRHRRRRTGRPHALPPAPSAAYRFGRARPAQPHGHREDRPRRGAGTEHRRPDDATGLGDRLACDGRSTTGSTCPSTARCTASISTSSPVARRRSLRYEQRGDAALGDGLVERVERDVFRFEGLQAGMELGSPCATLDKAADAGDRGLGAGGSTEPRGMTTSGCWEGLPTARGIGRPRVRRVWTWLRRLSGDELEDLLVCRCGTGCDGRGVDQGDDVRGEQSGGQGEVHADGGQPRADE